MSKSSELVLASEVIEAAKSPVTLVRNNEDGPEVVWDVKDKYSHARAFRINGPDGNPTKFAMVCGRDEYAKTWEPIRPVSDRYRPIKTEEIINLAVERLNGRVLNDKRLGNMPTRIDRFGTSLQISIPVDRPLELGKAFDDGHPWASRVKGPDVLFPTINIRNAYDATSSVRVDLGWFRLLCSNGMKVMIAGTSTRAIHTVNEVARVIDEVSSKDFEGDVKIIESLGVKKLHKKVVSEIANKLPKKWRDDFTSYAALGDNSAWSVINGLTYYQSNVYSLMRGRQLDPLIQRVQQMAMAA